MGYWIRNVLLAVLIGFGAYGASRYLAATEPQVQMQKELSGDNTSAQIKVRVAPLTQKAQSLRWVVYGKLHNQNPLELSVQKQGTVFKVLTKRADHVEKNEALLVLDPKMHHLQIAQATSRLEESQIQLEMQKKAVLQAEKNENHAKKQLDWSRKKLERQKVLFQKKVISKELMEQTEQAFSETVFRLEEARYRIENSKGQMEVSSARYAQAKIALEVLVLDKDALTLRAPMSGKVREIHAQVGEEVRPGVPLVSLESDAWEVRALLPFDKLQKYNTLSSSKVLEATMVLQGESVRLAPPKLVSAQSLQTLGMELVFAVPSLAERAMLQEGGAVQVAIAYPLQENAWRIPASALYRSRYVYTVTEGVLKRIPVRFLGFGVQNQDPIVASDLLLENLPIVIGISGAPLDGMQVTIERNGEGSGG